MRRTNERLAAMVQGFLVGVIETAKNGIATFENILKLQKQVDSQIQFAGQQIRQCTEDHQSSVSTPDD